MHADDLGDALTFLMQQYSDEGIVNVGVGADVTIRELGEIIRNVTGYQGRIVQDLGKPDGTPRKLMNTDRLSSLGWRARIELKDGVAATYQWFLDHYNK
jgi:GDP-L-fucose synthase